MKLLNIKMAERTIDRPNDWYVDYDGFKDTLEEMADQLEERSGMLSPEAARRLLELKQEIAKFRKPVVYNTNNS
jgi:hypothetical protein